MSVDSPNIFQKYLIPEESVYVQAVMRKAGQWSADSNLFLSRVASVASAIAAVVMSAFNAISYLLQVPIRILLNVVRFNPITLIRNFAKDWSGLFRSLIFVALGVTMVVAGAIFPGTIFPYFAPALNENSLEKIKQDRDSYKEQNQTLQNQVKRGKGVQLEMIKTLQENQELQSRLKQPPKKRRCSLFSCSGRTRVKANLSLRRHTQEVQRQPV